MKLRLNNVQHICFVLLLLASIFIFFLAEPALAEDSTVTRSLSTLTPDAKSVFDITLKLSDIQVGGIVETLPEGFSYVSTTHPGSQIEQSGRNLVFSVIDEKEIIYRVKAPSSGSGIFEGKWDNVLEGTDGKIAASSVTVKAGSGSSGSGTGNLNVLPTSTAAEGAESGNLSELPFDTEDLAKSRKTTSQAESSGARPQQEAEPDAKSKTSALDVKSETKAETESAPFTSPIFLLSIIGTAACIVNRGCKGGRI